MIGRQDGQWKKATIRVRYKDTDRMGVVYYGNYLTFFEVGRAEFMRDLGFSYAELEKEGYVLVVTEAAAKYHGNVGYDSMITVMTRIGNVSKVRVRFDYRILDQGGKLLVSGHTVHACLDSGRRIARLPEELAKAIGGETGS